MQTCFVKLFPLCLALTLGLSGCMAPSSLPLSGSPTSSQQSAQVKGQIILPYRAQDARVSSLPNPISYFFGEPAQADDVTVYVVPITHTDLSRIQAYVNGQPVSLRVTDIRFSGDQTILQYEIGSLPVLNPNGVHLLDIRLPNGDPLAGGVLTLVPGTVNTYNLTVETTALLDSVRELLGTRPVTELTLIRIRELERQPAYKSKLALIRSILQHNGKLRYAGLQRFDLDGFDWDDDDWNDCDRPDLKVKEKKGEIEFKYKCKD